MIACPAFAPDGSAGIAAVLRSVDCMTARTTGYAFGRLFSGDGVLLPALTTLLTLYVAFFAIGLLTGRTKLGVAALTPRMLTLGLVLTLSTSWAAYQGLVWNLAAGAPDQIASILVGTHGSATHIFAERLDGLFARIADAAAAAAAQTDAKKAAGFTPADLLWASALLLLLGTVGILVTARIALAALLALGPILIVLALFRGTRGLFEGWLKATVLFASVPLFTVLIGGGAIAMLVPFAGQIGGGDATLQVAVTMFVGTSVYCALTAMALKVATALVAGWRVPFGGARASSGRSSHEPVVMPLATKPTAVLPISDRGGQATPSGDRIREIVSGVVSLPAPNVAFAGMSRALNVAELPAAPQKPGSAFDPRISSIGSRYRQAALRPRKECVR